MMHSALAVELPGRAVRDLPGTPAVGTLDPRFRALADPSELPRLFSSTPGWRHGTLARTANFVRDTPTAPRRDGGSAPNGNAPTRPPHHLGDATTARKSVRQNPNGYTIDGEGGLHGRADRFTSVDGRPEPNPLLRSVCHPAGRCRARRPDDPHDGPPARMRRRVFAQAPCSDGTR